ncbi:hypothetical protein [uncultured Ruegeria sp.]|uniref:hypothetical protein n=1 Tax=uncultured Ruegeria sp. TaxID=259304 RepID=UPI002632D340|nr:hypothetical protein [uncultured Ruegeria sp.]
MSRSLVLGDEEALDPDNLWRVAFQDKEAPKEITKIKGAAFCVMCDSNVHDCWIMEDKLLRRGTRRGVIELRHAFHGKIFLDLLTYPEVQLIEHALDHGWVPDGTSVSWDDPEMQNTGNREESRPELDPFHKKLEAVNKQYIEVLCECHHRAFLSIKSLKEQYAPETKIRALLPKMKCSKCGSYGSVHISLTD